MVSAFRSSTRCRSLWLKLRIWRDDKEHEVNFAHGDAVAIRSDVVGPPLDRKHASRSAATAVTFSA